jgi:hypothetical protein
MSQQAVSDSAIGIFFSPKTEGTKPYAARVY